MSYSPNYAIINLVFEETSVNSLHSNQLNKLKVDTHRIIFI
ncbi:protein of unknown function (plasmid) [Carnobacterium divergens]|nr:protein of unknown function [Carnobacterium divergens]